jgi:hypothetical protein
MKLACAASCQSFAARCGAERLLARVMARVLRNDCSYYEKMVEAAGIEPAS